MWSSFRLMVATLLGVSLLRRNRQLCFGFVQRHIGTHTTTTTTTTPSFHPHHHYLSQQQPSFVSRRMATEAGEEEAGGGEKKITNRVSRDNANLEVRTIVDKLEMVISHLQSRRASDETIEAAKTIASLQEKRVALIKERDENLSKRKQASAVVGQLMRQQDELDDEKTTTLNEAKESSSQAAAGAAKAEEELEKIQSTVDTMLAGVPNLLDDNVPDGADESDNEEVYKWGDIDALAQKFAWGDEFDPQWHDDVARQLNSYAAEQAVKISGTRFVALTGGVAQLERAIASFFLDMHTTKHGYTEVSVPYIVGRSALEGTSQLPKFEEDLFAITNESHKCNGEDAFLIPTAEVPLTNLHRESVFEENDLPISYVAFTPCFRAEAGSYGRDTKGLIRTHQFNKVELVKITTAQDSNAQHELLTSHAEACLRELQLPYRKVRLCSGDIGFSARHCYDLEVWLPGAKEYREISSCSNTGDFQSRRTSIRYRPNPPSEEEQKKEEASNDTNNNKKKKKKKNKKPKPVLCHTINGSGLAVGRTVVAVLENYQQPDGTVVVPDVLVPYMGGKTILKA